MPRIVLVFRPKLFSSNLASISTSNQHNFFEYHESKDKAEISSTLLLHFQKQNKLFNHFQGSEGERRGGLLTLTEDAPLIATELRSVGFKNKF